MRGCGCGHYGVIIWRDGNTRRGNLWIVSGDLHVFVRGGDAGLIARRDGVSAQVLKPSWGSQSLLSLELQY